MPILRRGLVSITSILKHAGRRTSAILVSVKHYIYFVFEIYKLEIYPAICYVTSEQYVAHEEEETCFLK